tara:strand:+ start:2305 stop:2745 length:441 start_codon:yes stop_codon:yes gene_type:complete
MQIGKEINMNNTYLLELIRALIKKSGRTSKGISSKLGFHFTTISTFLNGKTDMRSSQFINLLNELDIDLEEILESKLKERTKAALDPEVGHDVSRILISLPPIKRKTLLNTVFTYIRDQNIRGTELRALKQYRDEIQTYNKGNYEC